MRRLSQINESQKVLEIQDEAVNYLTATQIRKYLEIADKFISDEGKYVCNWLIDNNSDYVKRFAKGDSNNALVNFYGQGVPNDKSLTELYKALGVLNKKDRLLEVPVFQTQEQFDGIISKKISPDEILLDLVTDRGRNEIAKKYTPLVHKIAKTWVGKAALTYDELVAAGYNGLVYAMNTYGKKSNKMKKKEEESGMEFDMSKVKSYTFLSYASQMIRTHILGEVQDSKLVRIPLSKQHKDREEQGFNAKSNTVSGDQSMGQGKDGEGQTLFDIIGGVENPGINVDRQEIDKLWDQICKALEAKFGEKTMDIFYNYFGWGGRKQLTGKEMAKKYGYKSPASITTEVVKVINFIKKDPKIYSRFVDIYELIKEHREDLDEYEDTTYEEPHSIKGLLKEDKDKELAELENYSGE